MDVGGTKIAAGVVDETGEIVERVRYSTPATDVEAIAETIANAVRDLAGAGVTSVGIGAAGYVSSDRSTVLFAPNLSWRNEPLGQRVSELAGVNVVVENDANAAAWGEYRFGAAAHTQSAAVVTIGTGVGGGIITGGHLVRGRGGFGGEFGHLNVIPDGPLCGCGSRGCWEALASGTALTRYAVERTTADPRGGAALLAYGNGAAMALGIFDTVAHYTAVGIADLVTLLDPEMVVLAGGVSEAGNILLDPVVEKLPDVLPVSDFRPAPPVRLATLGNDAGIIGAADLAREG